MRYSFIKPRQKNFLSLFSKIWVIFIALMVAFMLAFDFYIVMEAKSFKVGVLDLVSQREELENRILVRKTSKNDEESFYRTKEDKIDTLLLPPPLLEDQKPKGIIKIETQEVNSIKYLKERFEKSHNIIYALMLAEEYYLSKNYQDSNKWSIIANTIDADNEKSWILFAKSKLKLGHKQDAISALEAYLKNNKSKVVQNLLTQIMSGESID